MSVLFDPLSLPLEKLKAEEQPFRRIHRLIDVIEVWVKLHTVAVLSDYFSRKDTSPEIRGLLGAGLRTPSLGIWWQFARDIAGHMAENRIPPLHEGLQQAVLPKGTLFRLMEGPNNLISLRNQYAHGATPEDEACSRDLERFQEVVLSAIDACSYLEEIVLESRCAEPVPHTSGHATLSLLYAERAAVSLHPLLVRQLPCGRYFFYNDLRPKDVNLLNYETAAHWRDKNLRQHLLACYPLHEWRKLAPDEFRERIEQLTETFKGRREELRSIIAFAERAEPGIHTIWGPPGAGKSALIARAIQILRWPHALRTQEGYSFADSAATNLLVLEYFVWRGAQETTSPEYFLRNLSDRIEQQFRTGENADCHSLIDHQRLFRKRLEVAAHRLASGEQLILIIDGLDEAAEQSQFLEALPRTVPSPVKLIYASRPHPAVESLVYENLDRELRSRETLSGLQESDIRALLYDYVDKYSLPAAWVSALAARSEGNPLYVKLVCQGIQNGLYSITDPDTIPTGMGEVYSHLLKRIRRTPGVHALLMLLAEARDYLSSTSLAAMLQQLHSEVDDKLLPECQEILTTRQAGDSTEGYQLFHDSLRSYLRQHYPTDREHARGQLIAYCSQWKTLRGEGVAYAIRYLCPHLHDAIAPESPRKPALPALDPGTQLLDAIDDPDFRSRSVLLSGNMQNLRRDLKLAQRVAMLRDANCSAARRIFTYARLYHEEYDRLYANQLGQLELQAKQGNWDAVCAIAKIAQSHDQEGLLLLRALTCSSLRNTPTVVQKALQSLAQTTSNPVWEAFAQS